MEVIVAGLILVLGGPHGRVDEPQGAFAVHNVCSKTNEDDESDLAPVLDCIAPQIAQ